MKFIIADTFTSSLLKLTNEEKKAVKITAFDLQSDPESPGHSFHKLDGAKDKNFWSVRVNADIRIIVHRTNSSLLLCYVDHHDKAYQWAERRKLETHPKTGAAQFVEIRERVEEIHVPAVVGGMTSKTATTKLFDRYTDGDLLEWGVPQEWISDVRASNEDTLLELADHLPSEAAEALLEVATGGRPERRNYELSTDPFAHPDAQRRFRLMSDVEELRAALDYPWEKWTLFLHPSQRQIVIKDNNGPVRVSGSAGTGKTIVALHRVNHLLRNDADIRVLLTTFSEPLANALQEKLNRLLRDDPRLAERKDVRAIDSIALRLYEIHFEKPKILDDKMLAQVMVESASVVPGHKFGMSFLLSEWNDIVDANHISSLEEYRAAKRLGRKTRLSDAQRAMLWQIFQNAKDAIAKLNKVSMATIFSKLALHFEKSSKLPYDFIVVDEAQDISAPQLRFLAALGRARPDALFFTGDIGQRIFQTAFSWKALGVDIRGRSKSLTINYRTSHQIRKFADRLLASEVSDVDGNTEDRRGTVSVFNGPDPKIVTCGDQTFEVNTVSAWLKKQLQNKILAQEIGIFVRSDTEIDRACAAAKEAGLPYTVLDKRLIQTEGTAAIATMHLVKGLEYRAVAVMACDEDVLPSLERISNIADESDLVEVQETERHLFYVACTRARDALLITCGGARSEYLDDLLDKRH